MPVQATDIDQEIAYILQYWIQNNNRQITGTIGQNVVWNLAQFIKQNPENYKKATVVAVNSNYTTNENQCLVIFTNNASGTLNWIDNRWNKYYFVNGTDNIRNFSNGKQYYDISGAAQTTLPARTTLYIAKGDDDNWYEIGSTSGGSTSGIPESLDFEVDGSSFIATGESAKTFPLEWSGKNMLFIRNYVPQSKVNKGDGSTYFTWDRLTRAFTMSPAAFEDDVLQFYP